MRLKTFEGIITDNRKKFLSEVQEFCILNLAYLLDDESFKLSVEYEGVLGYNVTLQINGGTNWLSIKDSIVPFLHHFQKSYKVRDDHPGSFLFFIETNFRLKGSRYRWVVCNTVKEVERLNIEKLSTIKIRFKK